MKSIFTKEWAEAAGIRALKTFAQTMIATIGGGSVGLMEVSWVQALSVSAVAALLSLLTSVAGLPEVHNGETGSVE